jgi:hypothetical protein
MGRVQSLVVGYARNSTVVYHRAPYGSLHVDDASLSDPLYGLPHCCRFIMIHCMDYLVVVGS